MYILASTVWNLAHFRKVQNNNVFNPIQYGSCSILALFHHLQGLFHQSGFGGLLYTSYVRLHNNE